MPDDPNSNLDEQLTAWARKRREEAGAPFELHAVTRKMLQDEVARTYPKKSDEPAAESTGWWKMFWPRFALAGSLCLAMVILAGILLPGIARSKSKAQQIALVRQQEKALSADSGPRDAPAHIAPNSSSSRAAEAPVRHRADEAGKTWVAESQPPAAPPLAGNKPLEKEGIVQAEPKDARLKTEQPAKVDERSFSEEKRQLVLSDKAKEAQLPAGAAAPARALNLERERSQLLLRQRYGLAPAQAGGVTSATNALADELKLAQQRETDHLGTGNVYAVPPTSAPQRFAQVREHRVNLNSPPMPNVLSSFQLEQNGRQIRVVDADGSIYDGAIEQPPTEEAGRRGIAIQTAGTELKKNVEPEAKRVEGVSAATASEIAAAQNVFFRVAGTNRTLNQLVVFEGNFLATSNRLNEMAVGAKLNADQSAAAARQSLSQQGQQTPSALIRGQAMIGPSSRIEINAAPVSE